MGLPAPGPSIVVLSSLFPSALQPGAGIFIRERMFRVGSRLPLTVVAPVPWFPLQSLLRLWRRAFRPPAPKRELQQGIEVRFPRFFSPPGVLKQFDGIWMALGAFRTLRNLKRDGRLDLIDSHFGYPDGYAACLLARWLDVPFTVTMRGTESRHAADPRLSRKLATALCAADRVFCVSDSLRQVALRLGVDPRRAEVVGNGVDLAKFSRVDAAPVRRRLGIAPEARVLITVGGLVERKGFHRVIQEMPALLADQPDLHYLVVGGASPEGDFEQQLRSLAVQLSLQSRVHFVGPQPPEALRDFLSASDVFVLSSRNEGWANVLLEAMACGLPVVASDVGGNAEVICSPLYGYIVPFGDGPALQAALRDALRESWDHVAIRRYAEANTWDERVGRIVGAMRDIGGSAA